jgi:hypothetical protein
VNVRRHVNDREDERDQPRHLEELLRAVPVIESVSQEHHVREGSLRADCALELLLRGGKRQRWIVEVRTVPLEPRTAQVMVMLLRELLAQLDGTYGVVMAPYVSPASADILARGGVGFVDLSGNCRLVSGPLFIERSGFPNAHARKAGLRSLFTPGAERVLRAVLDPTCQGRSWTVRELAHESFPGVSIGQAHKVVKALEGQLHLRRADRGLLVVEPGKLLRAWAAGYRAGRNRPTAYYSLLDQDELRRRFGAAIRQAGKGGGGALASYSAAAVLSPAVRQPRFFAYWRGDRAMLEEVLELKPVGGGENVVVYEPYDEGVFYPAGVTAEPVTCPVQTYLDVRAAHGRGGEAAEAIHERCLKDAYSR